MTDNRSSKGYYTSDKTANLDVMSDSQRAQLCRELFEKMGLPIPEFLVQHDEQSTVKNDVVAIATKEIGASSSNEVDMQSLQPSVLDLNQPQLFASGSGVEAAAL